MFKLIPTGWIRRSVKKNSDIQNIDINTCERSYEENRRMATTYENSLTKRNRKKVYFDKLPFSSFIHLIITTLNNRWTDDHRSDVHSYLVKNLFTFEILSLLIEIITTFMLQTNNCNTFLWVTLIFMLLMNDGIISSRKKKIFFQLYCNGISHPFQLLL